MVPDCNHEKDFYNITKRNNRVTKKVRELKFTQYCIYDNYTIVVKFVNTAFIYGNVNLQQSSFLQQ